MTADQRKSLDRLLRDLPFDLGGEVGEQRPLMEHMLTAQPLPDDVNVTARELGGVRVVEVGIGGVDPVGTILHLHGGGFALGSADSSVGMAAELARRTRTVVVSVDYALAPENPFPIAGEQVVAAYDALIEREGDGRRVVVSGESAGGNLALGLLLAVNGDDRRAPAGAVLLSPMTDLTASGASFTSKAAADPALSARAIVTRVGDYLNGTGVSAEDPTVSPVFADLHGLPPLLIQAGSHEVLLDDATRLAVKAAADDVAVILDITPGVPHVFQAFAAILTEGDVALERVARFVADQLNHD